jgi:hypothetical protein
MVTDRPGNGNAAVVVPRSRLQLEASANFLHQDLGGSSLRQLSFPTLIRYGVLSGLELRLGSGLAGIDATEGSDDRFSLTDTSVGAKYGLLTGSGSRPDAAIMLDVFLPSGQGGFTGDAVVPDARAAFGWSLPKSFGLLVNLGVDVPEVAGDRVARLGYVVNLGYTPASLAGGKLSVFAELYGRLGLDDANEHAAQLDVGAAYLVAPRWQLDVFSQHALTDAAPDLQIAMGLSTWL